MRRRRARLAAEREDGDGAAVAGAAAGAPGAAHVLRRVAREVEQHHMVHVRAAGSRGGCTVSAWVACHHGTSSAIPAVSSAVSAEPAWVFKQQTHIATWQ